MESPDTLEFTERSVKSPGTYRLNQSAVLTVDGTVRFAGVIVSLHPSGIGKGPVSVGYRCMGLAWLANKIFVTAPDGSGRMIFNLPATDAGYIAANSGLNVGQILTRLYTAHAAQLAAVGIVAWSPAELALLTVVPPDPVHLGGLFWNAATSLVSQWHNKYGAFITADGVIHHPNLLTLPVSTLTLDTDPVILDSISEDFSECYTQVILRGADDVQGAYLSYVDKTLSPRWSAANQAAWTYLDYITPAGAYELGTINSMTSTTLSVTATAPIPIPYSTTTKWSALAAEVCAQNQTATGAAAIGFSESRRVTANTVPSGNTYTMTVDTAFSNSGYTSYSIRGVYATVALTWRDFTVVPEWISTRLVKRFSHSVPWSPTDGIVTQTLLPMASICFTSASGYKSEFPMTFQVIPSDLSAACTTRATATVTIAAGAVTGFTSLVGGSGYPRSQANLLCSIVGGAGSGATAHAVTNSSGVVTSVVLDTGGTGYTTTTGILIGVQPGRIVFNQPICAAYSSQAIMNLGGSNVLAPTDIKVLVPYSRGVISATAPAGGGYQGTAYTVNGVRQTLYREFPQWTDYKDTVSYATLAQEILDTVKNTVIEGSITYLGKYSTALTLGRALHIAGTGYSTGYEAMNAVIRTVTLDYAPDGGPVPWVTSLGFSTRLKPFSGDRLYAHASWGSERQLAGAHLNFGLTTGRMIAMSQASQANMRDLTTAPDQTMSGDPADYGISGPGKQGKTQAQKTRGYNAAIDEAEGGGGGGAKKSKYSDEQLMDTASEIMSDPEESSAADAQTQRRERAASHGSIRNARGLGGAEPGTGSEASQASVDPANQIGSDLAEQMMRPGRRRALERERRSHDAPGEDDVHP